MKTIPLLISLAVLCLAPSRLAAAGGAGAHLFVADSGSGIIYEYAPDGTQSVFATGTGRPYGLAFDGAGNLYVANFDGGIYKIAPNGAGSTFDNLYNGPAGLAVDSASNVFVGVFGNGYIFEYTADGTQSTFGREPDHPEYFDYNYGRPVGLAFDSAGNLFASDQSYSLIYKGVPNTPFAHVAGEPWGLAFDSRGNLYVADSSDGYIYKFANVSGTLSSSYTTFATNLNYPTGLASDSADNLFVADYDAGDIYKFDTNGARAVFASGLLAPVAVAFAPANLPQVQFSASPTNGTAPVIVQFNAPNVDNLGNTITSWHWDFGDGSTGNGQKPTHTYTAGGDFLPHLVATNNNSAAVFGSGPLIAVSLPTVAFTATPTDGMNPLPVQFMSLSVDSSGATITSWNWDFDDGSTGAGQNPLHTYAVEGSFQPSLVATNNEGIEVIGSGPAIVTSPWGREASPTTYALYGVTVGNHRIVAVGDSNAIVTSADGADWSADSVATASSRLAGVTYGHGLFVASGDGGVILTSADGINWTQQTSGTTNGLWGVTYGNGLFVVAGDNGTIITSPDGVHWAEQTNGLANQLDSVAFNNGQFVATGYEGAAVTSPDGTNWTSHYSGADAELWGVAAGNGQFVAVGDYGEIVTSTDGTNWNWQNTGVDDALHGVAFGNGHFVAVGDSGTLLLSTDGMNWMSDNAGGDDTLYGVSYFSNGSFVIVGDNGVILFNQPPRLGMIQRPTTGQIEFNLTGLDGFTAIIEATPTLSPADWQPVATNIISQGIVTFSDFTTHGSMYYRALVQ
jgi:PKD repeat protein